MESSARALEKTAETGGFPWRALALSVAAHALLLVAYEPSVSAVRETAFPLHGSLRPQQREITPPVAQTVPRAAEARRVPRPVLAAVGEPATVALALPAAVSPAPTLANPASGVPHGPSRAAEPALAEAEAEPPATPLPDAAGLRQYRLALASEARRFRHYPAAARRAELTGTVEVRVAVAAGGAARRAELHRSSGHALLDAAALDMLNRAAERAEPPASLRGQSFAVLLPVAFEVEE